MEARCDSEEIAAWRVLSATDLVIVFRLHWLAGTRRVSSHWRGKWRGRFAIRRAYGFHFVVHRHPYFLCRLAFARSPAVRANLRKLRRKVFDRGCLSCLGVVATGRRRVFVNADFGSPYLF